MSFDQLKSKISNKEFVPVYFLHGEESYFLDQLASLLEKEVITEAEASFNKEVFYGPDAKASQVLNACRSFPMMAQRRLVMLKEAHRFPKEEMEKLTGYFRQPAPTTVLVVVSKGGKNKLTKTLGDPLRAGGGIEFHVKKMWEKDIRPWLSTFISEQGLQYDPDVPGILLEHLGDNIGLLANEVAKIALLLKASGQSKITRDFVFETINIDKEFNVFELINALGQRQSYKCHLIIDRLTQNPKLNPPVGIVNNLFRYFHNIALAYSHKLNDIDSLKATLGLNYPQARDALNGRRQYPLAAVYRNIAFIETVDLQLKGIQPTLMEERHLLKTLVWQLLN